MINPLSIKIFVTTFLVICSLKVYGYGLADWQHYTPGGNIMGDNGSGTALTLYGKQQEIFRIRKWYFYKNHIVGLSDKGFFIVNEEIKEIYIFNTELEWRNSISQNNLTPLLWTRWYSDNWVDLDWIIIWLFFGFIIAVPLIGLFLWILYKAITVENFEMSKPNTAISFSVIFLFFMIIILDSFPQSF
jgi:hypothetical protein